MTLGTWQVELRACPMTLRTWQVELRACPMTLRTWQVERRTCPVKLGTWQVKRRACPVRARMNLTKRALWRLGGRVQQQSSTAAAASSRGAGYSQGQHVERLWSTPGGSVVNGSEASV
jgi:hypothetical protein